MGIPDTYDNLTVKQYLEVTAITDDLVYDKLEKKERLIKYFTGLDAETLPLAEVTKYCERIDLLLLSSPNVNIVQDIKVGDKKYHTDTDVTKLCADQYTAIKEFGKDPKKNFTKLLGLIYYRADEGKPKYNGDDYEDIGNELLNAPIGSVYGSVFFYSRVLEELNQTLPIYLAVANHEIETEMKAMMKELKVDGPSSLKGTDGIML